MIQPTVGRLAPYRRGLRRVEWVDVSGRGKAPYVDEAKMKCDTAFLRVAFLLRASKAKSYRASIRQVFKTLVTFLQQNGLTTRVLLLDEAEVDEAFVIRRFDLTDEGFESYRTVEQPWLNAIDRGASTSDVSRLERALRAFRSKNASPKGH